jgi:hypothetical protein
MIADEVSDAQKKFLEERQVLRSLPSLILLSQPIMGFPPRVARPPIPPRHILAPPDASHACAQKMRTKYEEGEIKGNYKSADDVQDKKITYTSVVIGLIVIAFVAPMIQFFYYTGGD